VSFSSVVMAVGVGAVPVGVDEVVVVGQACDVAMYSYVQSLKSQLSGYSGKDYIMQTCCPVA
jgi:hypothetical protein